ncbi:hypothetical protein GCM10010407_03010 [Rarobacter incanus]
MIDAGRRSIWNAGLTLDLNDSHFDDLIRSASVPRSSVFRIWQTKADYLVDLYETLGGPQGGARGSLFAEQILKDEVFAHVEDVAGEFAGKLDTPQGRRSLVEEVVRRGVKASFDAYTAPSEWQTYAQMMISAPVLTDLPDGARIADTQVQTERNDVIARLADRYRVVFNDVLNLHPRDEELRYEYFVIAGMSLIEGFATREVLAKAASADADHAVPSLHDLSTATVKRVDRDGVEREWLPVALAYLAVLDTFFETR